MCLKIYNSNIYNNSITSKQENNVPEKSITSPSFKSGMTSLLNLSGNVMQGIEDKGFLASFLIQDFGGMTVPRTAAGFLRDKEHTGHYNIQEGTEVLGREGLTGPCMMAVAPICLWVAAKAGRSTQSCAVIGGARSDKQSKKLSLGTLPDLRRKNEDKSI